MAVFLKIIYSLFLFLQFYQPAFAAENEAKEVLVESESKDGKLEIIKQIKKVNNDGSYTIGYEADDGSFKIESRDVLGNVKGTYGYVDETGEIKRVSYSTSNSSETEVIPKPESSVVQRIPKTNRTQIYTTRRPFYSTTQNPSSTTALQRLAKLRASTTEKPVVSDSTKPTIEYPSSTPRILLQGRPIVRSTASTQAQTQKSEGQLVRPEVVSIKPTELPLFRRLALKHPILNDNTNVKPIDEERSNILRRQLSPEDKTNFDPHHQVFMLHQGLGNDATDVYSSSVTTGTPRPLFTTTARPRVLLSSTTPQSLLSRAPVTYQNSRNVEVQESTTRETVNEATSTPVPVVQIPANRPTQEPLVAIKHPFQDGTILVPLSQLQRSRVVPQQEFIAPTTPRPEVQPVFVRRPVPPQFRPIPVQVDENGFIREAPRIQPVPTPVPRYNVNNEVENDIDGISPPVSTRDFQRLLQQLILRQTRLEKISTLTRNSDYYQQRYRPEYRPVRPYYVPRAPESRETGPVQFLHEDNSPRQRQFVQQIPRQEQELYTQQSQSFVPTRRVARLLQDQRPETKEEYLPPDVREMLLLRMLQLAINPALPINEEEMVEETTAVPQYKKVPIRNVEILGEESDDKILMRNKRYKDGYLI